MPSVDRKQQEMTPESATASTVTTTCDVTGCRTSLDVGHGAGAVGWSAAKAELLYVTDPLCSGCWALEPAWRRLLYRYGEQLSVSHVYGGLLPGWDGFSDRNNAIAAAADVAPHWDAVSRASGQPIDSRVWLSDPPASSYPASIAAAAVRLVAPEQEGRYLRRLRELVFLERRNIARPEVLRAALAAIEIDRHGWQAMLDGGAAERVFAADRALARRLGVRLFPTVLIEGAAGRPGVVTEGSLSPQALERAVLEAVATPLAPSPESESAAAVLDAYETATSAELAAALGLAVPAAERVLMRAGARRRTVANGTVWER
jgi:putative protein-disulfide isomerase